jgi:hypothetical protein
MYKRTRLDVGPGYVGGKVKYYDHSGKTRIYAMIIVLLAAIIFLSASAVMFYQESAFKKYFKETTATISRIEEIEDSRYNSSTDSYDINVRHKVYITYTVDDTTYNDIEFNSYNNFMYEGQKIQIFYDTRNPKIIQTPNEKIIAACMTLGAGGISIVAFFILIVQHKRRKNLE